MKAMLFTLAIGFGADFKLLLIATEFFNQYYTSIEGFLQFLGGNSDFVVSFWPQKSQNVGTSCICTLILSAHPEVAVERCGSDGKCCPCPIPIPPPSCPSCPLTPTDSDHLGHYIDEDGDWVFCMCCSDYDSGEDGRQNSGPCTLPFSGKFLLLFWNVCIMPFLYNIFAKCVINSCA